LVIKCILNTLYTRVQVVNKQLLLVIVAGLIGYVDVMRNTQVHMAVDSDYKLPHT